MTAEIIATQVALVFAALPVLFFITEITKFIYKTIKSNK